MGCDGSVVCLSSSYPVHTKAVTQREASCKHQVPVLFSFHPTSLLHLKWINLLKTKAAVAVQWEKIRNAVTRHIFHHETLYYRHYGTG